MQPHRKRIDLATPNLWGCPAGNKGKSPIRVLWLFGRGVGLLVAYGFLCLLTFSCGCCWARHSTAWPSSRRTRVFLSALFSVMILGVEECV